MKHLTCPPFVYTSEPLTHSRKGLYGSAHCGSPNWNTPLRTVVHRVGLSTIPSPESPSRAIGRLSDLQMDTPQESLSAVVVALSDCRTALERSLSGLREDTPRRTALEAVREPLAHFAAVTAEHEVPPERMIVMLKRMLRELPVIHRWRDTERENISHELVQISIASYYEFDGDDERKKR